ncbi:MAG: hypothetical protein RBU29_05590 [bacterium]|nr:hypothetical protein [bacterium]
MNSRFWLLSLAFCLFALPAALAESPAEVPFVLNGATLPLLYTSDFANDQARWEPTDPKAWKVITENDRPVYSLFQQSKYTPPVRLPFNQSILKDLWVSDFVIEVEAKSTGRQYAHRDICVFFGKQDETHLYYTHVSPSAVDGDPHAHSIFIVDATPRLSIATERVKKTLWENDTYYKIRVVRNSQTGEIEVFFHDMTTPIMKAKDTTFPVGRVGIGSFDDTGDFRSVKIWGKKAEPIQKNGSE